MVSLLLWSDYKNSKHNLPSPSHWSPYSRCYYSPQHRKLFCNGPLREEANVANCVWNCGGGQGYAHSLCWPVYTANMSEWRIVGLKDFHSRGAERFPSAQRCEVKGILYSAAIKRKWISLTATDALVRSGNIKLWFCIRMWAVWLVLAENRRPESRQVLSVEDGTGLKFDFLWAHYLLPRGGRGRLWNIFT